MKIVETPNRGTELIGVGETRKISVSADGTMIKNLISSIYSDKEKTVVRELIANAMDAHAAIGADEPIDVLLPTAYDPTFLVRDYGVGMDHRFVLDLYSVLGFSTKKETNEQTGMFGVGSKSPLSITDTFTVRCFDKPGWNGAPHLVGDNDLNETGRIRLYTVAIGNDGIPTISHTFDVLPKATDQVERGGTEVRVPVDPSNRHRLVDGLLKQQFCWFDKKINFGSGMDLIKDRLFKGVVKLAEGLYLAEPSKSDVTTGTDKWRVCARQGAAVYDITEDRVRSDLGDGYTTALRALCAHGRTVMFDLPIGTVDVTTAREAIQYNAVSQANLVKRMVDSLIDFEQTLAEQIGDEWRPVELIKILSKTFVANEAERNKFASLKTVSSLLPVVSKTMRANYNTWYAAQPLVKVQQRKQIADGTYELDEKGDFVLEEVEVPPAHRPPVSYPKYRTAELASGKVLMCEGTVYSIGTECSISFGQFDTDFKVTYPNAFYVIPLHLANWKLRISKHVKATFAGDDFPDRVRDGMNVGIIRCAKKSIPGIVARITQDGAAFAIFGEDVLPAVEAAQQKSVRQTSKNGVFEYTGSAWGDTKVEPDFDEPAYYAVRVGQSNDVYTNFSGAYTGKTKMISTAFSTASIERLVRNARAIGLIDADTPIYRLSEKQAERMTRSAPTWMPLIESVAECVAEKLSQNEDLYSLENSDLAPASTEYGFRSMLSEAAQATPSSSSARKMVFDRVYRLCYADPLFMTVAAVTYVQTNLDKFHKDLAEKTKHASNYKAISNMLFGAYIGGNDAKQKIYTSIDTKYQARYKIFNNFVSGKSCAETQTHMDFYVDGFLNAYKTDIATQPAMPVTPIITESVNLFKNLLDKIHADLYPATVLEVPKLGATGND